MLFRALVLLPLAALAAAPVHAQPAADRVAQSITVQDVRAHAEFLAGDALAGRRTPSPGQEAAAEYIAAKFRAWGLHPAGDSGGFVQRYAVRVNRVPPAERRFFFTAGGRQTAWTHGRDYFVLASRGGSAESAPVLYAGLAAQAGALPAEARGAVLVYDWPGTPMENTAFLSNALTAAVDAGAAAVVVLTDAGVGADSIAWYGTQLEGSNMTLPMPMAGLREAPARALFRAAGQDLDALRRRAAGGIVPLRGVRMTLAAPARTVMMSAPNVVAVLPGSDPALRDSYVVISAHFDHMGIGHPDAHGDSIYNGADDNASGTSAMLAAAQAFASLPERPARSVVFLAVTGEEMGLQGAVHWVQHPTVPWDGIVANLNLDMVGRNAPDTLYVMGQDYSSLGPLAHRVSAAHPELGFALPSEAETDPKLRWFSRSDHVAFIHAGIPVLFFTTMPHPDYHRTTDAPGTLDVEKLTRVSRMLFHTAHAVASDREVPRWTPTGHAEAMAAVQ
ncbi:MAG TPA: M28 family peptidase [Longimicrobium sp.]|nr:M28 family peptidase [Longimicrobium sp.]